MAWTLDPAHTSVSFSAKHLGVATVRGHFGTVTAELDLDDPDDPSTGRGRVIIDAKSIDTGNRQRDDHLRSPDFLDVDRHPNITFEIKRVERNSDDGYRVIGDLTIREVTRDIALDYEHSGSVTDPFGNTKVGGTLTGVIDRTDWGLKWNVPLGGGGWLVSDKVKLEIDGELARTKEAVEEEVAAEAAV